MKVRDVMNVQPITIQADDAISEAAKVLRENKISGMPVLDGEKVVGIVSESDLCAFLAVSDEGEGSLWLPALLRSLRFLPRFCEEREDALQHR